MRSYVEISFNLEFYHISFSLQKNSKKLHILEFANFHLIQCLKCEGVSKRATTGCSCVIDHCGKKRLILKISFSDIKSEELNTSSSMNFHTTLHSTPTYWTIWTQGRRIQTLRLILWLVLSFTPSQMLCAWLVWWARSAAVTWYHRTKMCTCLLLVMMRRECWLQMVAVHFFE